MTDREKLVQAIKDAPTAAVAELLRRKLDQLEALEAGKGAPT